MCSHEREGLAWLCSYSLDIILQCICGSINLRNLVVVVFYAIISGIHGILCCKHLFLIETQTLADSYIVPSNANTRQYVKV